MDDQRAEFEAWADSRKPRSLRSSVTDDYNYPLGNLAFEVWKAATQPQQERIAELERDLQFVERWANHHGAKPHTTAKEALSVIQHYPPITRITRGYADGVVPDTFDPYARIAELEAQVQALSLDAGRWRYSVAIGENQVMNWLDVWDDWDGDGDFTTAIDAAIAASKGESGNANI